MAASKLGLRKSQLYRLTNWLISKRLYYEIRPRSQVKVFAPNPNKKIPVPKKRRFLQGNVSASQTGARRNKLGIQMLSKPIYDQVFLEGFKDDSNDETVRACRQELAKHQIKCENTDVQEEVDFQVPPLKGKNIEEHFLNIGNEQVNPYKALLNQLLTSIPNPPSNWLMQEGWTRYAPNQVPQKVDFPWEDALVFDVEVCMKVGKAPTLATAVSNKAWYGWVSPTLVLGAYAPNTSYQYQLHSLIPLESTNAQTGAELSENQRRPKVVVGHNVSYDRARIKEQYWLKRTGTRFLDTMSMHVCVSGLTSYQRAVTKSANFTEDDDAWKNNCSLNNLADVHNLYCGSKLNKETRNLFVEGNLMEIQESFQTVMSYCSSDITATYNVLKNLYPMFLKRFPHPVTLAGMLELGSAYLPINQHWNRYIADAEHAFEDLENESKILLARRSDQACQLMNDSKYQSDLWLWDEDWDTKEIKIKMPLKVKRQKETPAAEPQTKDENDEGDELAEKFKNLWKTAELLPKVRPLLAGYPNW